MPADLMERTRAAVTLLNASPSDRRIRAFAFLCLFHPEIPLAKRLRMAAEIGQGR